MKCPEFLTRRPQIDGAAFIAPSADIVGAVTLGQDASVWYQCVLRGDIHEIVIGDRTNVQDGTIVHLASDRGVWVGQDVTIGHRAIIHACTIEDAVLVGMGATIMDESTIGEGSIIGAGALVTKAQQIPPRSLVLGSPAKVVRAVTDEEMAANRGSAEKYVQVARHFRSRQIGGN